MLAIIWNMGPPGRPVRQKQSHLQLILIFGLFQFHRPTFNIQLRQKSKSNTFLPAFVYLQIVPRSTPVPSIPQASPTKPRQITQMSSQQPPSLNAGSFSLIWYYWFKKYMQRRAGKSTPLAQLTAFRQKYNIEAIETYGQGASHLLQQRIEQIKQKTSLSSAPQLHSSLSSTTNSTLSLSNPPLFYTINPETQAPEITQLLQQQNDDHIDRLQLLNELNSYYRNSKCIYIIYKVEKQYQFRETVHKLINYSYRESSLRTSKINLSSLANEDDERGESLLESYDKVEDKIEGLEILDKMADLDGLEIWDAKYYNIPHSFVKVKKNSWTRSLPEPRSPPPPHHSHPCQPKLVCQLPVLPRLRRYRPSPAHLPAFLSFMQLLWSSSPHLCPTCESIFEYNNMPYIFAQDSKEVGIGTLCYYIVYGERDGPVTEALVDRFLETNWDSELGRAIRYMRDRVGSRNVVEEGGARGLLGGDAIW